MPNGAEGILALHFAKKQAAFDTIEAFAATDAVSPVLGSMKLEPTQSFEKLKEAVGTASLQAEAKGQRGGKWSGQFYVKPAAAGTAPDIGDILEAAMGSVADGDTDVVYSLSDTAKIGLQLMQQVGSNLQQVASGGYVEQLSIEASGASTPTITASGGYARHGWAAECVGPAAGISGGETTFTLPAAHRGALGVGAVVKLGTQDNSGAGYTVTAYNWDTGVVTFAPALAAAPGGSVAADAAIVPIAPTPTVGGTVIEAMQHSLSVAGVSLGFISASVSLNTGIKGLDKEATTDRVNRLARGERVVEGELQVFFLDGATGNAAIAGRAWNGTTQAISLRLGPDAAGKRMTISIPKARLEVVAWSVPGDDVVTGSLKFVARQSSAAADEMTITLS
jgi:hypothetical protein